MDTVRKFRFTFEARIDGKWKGVVVEGTSFTQALEEAKTKLKTPIMDIEHIKTERYTDGLWFTLFDPLAGRF